MSDPSLLTEKAILHLIAENKTKRAIDAIESYFAAYQLQELQDKFSVLQAKWKAYQSHQTVGSASYEKLSEEKARIDVGLISLTRHLFHQLQSQAPDADPAAVAQLKGQGIREDKFKNQVLLLLLISKLIIIGAVLFYLSVDALNNNQALAIIGMVLPVLSVYMGLIFRNFLKDRYVTDKQQVYPFIKNRLRWMTYLLFVLYVIFTLQVIGNQAAGEYCDEYAMTAADQLQELPPELAVRYCAGLTTLGKWMGLIETGLGTYIGEVVFALFRKED